MSSLQEKFPDIKQNVMLANYSTFKIGGPADYFIDCKDITQLPSLVSVAQDQDLPIVIIGGGSNTIFHENGFRGLVIKLSAFNLDFAGAKVTVEAGVIFNALIMQTLKHDLIGMENLFGIPGTLGGAIRGNAGAHGTEIQDLIESITYFDPETNEVKTAPKSDFEFTYRSSTFKKWQQSGHPKYILRATINLIHDSKKAQKASTEIFQIQKIRNAKYPFEPNCGSFFKNPSPAESPELVKNHPEIPLSSGNIPAGYLSEQAGCKGLRVGDAQVSEKHGNFLINLGQATQSDLLALITIVQTKVAEKFQIQLENEVQIISENGLITNLEVSTKGR